MFFFFNDLTLMVDLKPRFFLFVSKIVLLIKSLGAESRFLNVCSLQTGEMYILTFFPWRSRKWVFDYYRCSSFWIIFSHNIFCRREINGGACIIFVFYGLDRNTAIMVEVNKLRKSMCFCWSLEKMASL